MSARVTGVASALAAVNASIESMGREWSVDLDLGAGPRQPYRTLTPRTSSPGPQPTNGQVVDHLAKMGRDPFKLAPADRATIARSLVGAYRQGLRGAALLTSIASGWRGLVAQRMRAGTAADAVSAEWAARKARLGYPTTSSVASGQLVRAIESALPRVRRIR